MSKTRTTLKTIVIIFLGIGSLFWLVMFWPIGLLGLAFVGYLIYDKSVDLVPCPNCGYKISKKAIICPKCGREFERN
jgi:DNA-directed RNA polymerase subunit RPC12/RpoP